MKKGYVYMLFFVLFISIFGPIKYRLYKRDLYLVPLNHIILEMAIAFLIYIIPGILIVRWCYKMKERVK